MLKYEKICTLKMVLIYTTMYVGKKLSKADQL